MKANFFTVLLKRIASERPEFWKKVTTFGLIALVILGAVIGLNEYEIISLPEKWLKVLTHASTFLAGVFAAGSATTASPDLLDDKTIQNAKSSEKIR